MDIKNNVLELIGNTPIVKLNNLTKGLKPTILAKLEYLNPGGSAKDRTALSMVEAAEASGKLLPGGTIVGSTSGNFGIGLATVAAVKGYKLVLVLSDSAKPEKINLMRSMGAEVVITPEVPDNAPNGRLTTVQKIVEQRKAVFLAQHSDLAATEKHYKTTGPEIWNQTDGKVTHLVAMVGLGGTISGIAKFFKEKNPNVKIIAGEPIGSIFFDMFYRKKIVPEHIKPYLMEGVGIDDLPLPAILDLKLIDKVVQVSDKDSFTMARRLAKEEGIIAGSSSGAAVHIALQLAQQLTENDTIVVLIHDSGLSYAMTQFSEDWMKAKNFIDIPNNLRLAEVLLRKKTNFNLISVMPYDTVEKALILMKSHHISQMPVIKAENIIGSISEERILQKTFEDPKLLKAKVSEVMAPGFMQMMESDYVDRAYSALQSGEKAVIVIRDKKPIGILTTIDLIGFSRKK